MSNEKTKSPDCSGLLVKVEKKLFLLLFLFLYVHLAICLSNVMTRDRRVTLDYSNFRINLT